MNNITIVGNLTRDPEVRTTSSGKTMTKCTVAVNRFKDSVDYFNVVIWGKSGEYIGSYAKKGDKIGCVGSMRNDAYEKDGVKKDFWQLNANDATILSSRTGGPRSGAANASSNLPDDDDFDPFADE